MWSMPVAKMTNDGVSFKQLHVVMRFADKLRSLAVFFNLLQLQFLHLDATFLYYINIFLIYIGDVADVPY